jgi:hypothetical protein
VPSGAFAPCGKRSVACCSCVLPGQMTPDMVFRDP